MGEDDALYRAMFDHAAVPLLVFERETGAIVAANHCITRWLGFEPAALHGRTLAALGIGAIEQGEVQLRTASGRMVAASCRTEVVGTRVLVTLFEIPGVEGALYTNDTPALAAFERRLAVQRELGQVLADARDLEASLPLAIATLCAYDNWDGGGVWLPVAGGTLQCYGTWLRPGLAASELVEVSRSAQPERQSELLGRVLATGRAEKISLDPSGGPHGVAAFAAGMRRALAFPIFRGSRVLGVVGLAARSDGSLDIPELGLLDSAGQMLGLFVERMRAEASLRASEQRLQQVIDTLHEGIIIVDDHGSVLYFNPAAREAYGFSGDGDGWLSALYDRDTFETRTLDGGLVDPEDRPSSRVRRGEIVRGVELWVARTATGARRALRFSGSRLRQPDGRHVVVLAFSDITGRVESTLALRELNDTLEQRVDERTAQLEVANQELEAFTYSVSHDLRAPVRAITSFSQIVVEDFGEGLPDEARRLLGRVQAGGARLGELVDDLLAFSRLGRHSLRLREVDVDGLVQETRFAGKVNLVFSPLGKCTADASLLEQVWTNLIENALKYSSTRPNIAIDISRRDSDVDAIFAVRDNGVGFDMRHSDKLFGVFQRLHSSEEFEGTGVGLANVRRIVERHGGTVAARSTLDEGSTFEFSLPLRSPQR
ncbi:MAG: ATP-binding protein [Kofleriaceae bacterium]